MTQKKKIKFDRINEENCNAIIKQSSKVTSQYMLKILNDECVSRGITDIETFITLHLSVIMRLLAGFVMCIESFGGEREQVINDIPYILREFFMGDMDTLKSKH